MTAGKVYSHKVIPSRSGFRIAFPPARKQLLVRALLWSGLLLTLPPAVAGQQPHLPRLWVNDQECGPPFARTLYLKADGSGDEPDSQSGLNQALTTWANDTVSYHIVIDAGSLLSGKEPITVPAGTNTSCAVVESSTPLPAGRTVCSHGVTDASGPDPGARNPGCTNDVGSMYTLEQTGTHYIVNFQSKSNHVVFRDAELRFGATSAGASYNPAVAMGHNLGTPQCQSDPACDQETIAQAPAHIGFDRVYFHGYDPGEAATFVDIASISRSGDRVHVTTAAAHNLLSGNSVIIQNVSSSSKPSFNGTFGPITVVSPTQFTYRQTGGKASGRGGQEAYGSGVDIQAFIGMDCRYCWIVNSYSEKIHDTGVDSHAINGANGPGPILVAHNWIEGGSEDLIWGGAVPQISANIPSDIEIRRNRFTRDLGWEALTGIKVCTINPQTEKCPQQWAMKNMLETKVCQRCLLDANIYENSWTDGQQGALRVMDVDASGEDMGLNPTAIVADVTETNEIWRHSAEGLVAASRSASGGNGGGPSLPEQRVMLENILMYDIANPAFGPSNSVAVYLGGVGNNFTCSAQRDAQGLTSTYSCTLSDGNPFSQIDVNVGDPVYVQNCHDDKSFETPPNQLGPPALAVTATSVTISNPGTPNASTLCGNSAGKGGVNNAQGWQQFFQWDHNTSAFEASLRILGLHAYSFERNLTHTANIEASLYNQPGGIICSAGSPGTGAEGCMDLTTLQLNNEVFEGLVPSQYTEYPSGKNGGSSASTLYFPENITCATSNPSGEIDGNGKQTCVGWAGFVDGTAYPPANWFTFNYHDLALCNSLGNSDYGPDSRCSGPSLFSAGQSQQAISGTQQNPAWRSMGPSLLDIDSAFALSKYVCHSSCGSGPYQE